LCLDDVNRLGPAAHEPVLFHSKLQLAMARLAALEVQAGEVESARDLLQRLRGELAQTQQSDFEPPLADYVEGLLAFRESGDVRGLFAPHDVGSIVHPEAWRAAGRGDTASLARAFYGRWPQFRDNYRPLWLMRLGTDHDALLTQVRWGGRSIGLWILLEDAIKLHGHDLMVARVAEDSDWATEIEDALQRHREALLRRDVSVLLAVSERF
jgi:hypothetical protein